MYKTHIYIVASEVKRTKCKKWNCAGEQQNCFCDMIRNLTLLPKQLWLVSKERYMTYFQSLYLVWHLIVNQDITDFQLVRLQFNVNNTSEFKLKRYKCHLLRFSNTNKYISVKLYLHLKHYSCTCCFICLKAFFQYILLSTIIIDCTITLDHLRCISI